jgi:hypothetical protein
MTAEHSSGPWSLHLHDICLGDDVAHISESHGCAIAMVHSGCENINPGRLHKVTREEAQASAYLFAAALESHEANMTALSWLDRWGSHVGGCRGGLKCTCGFTRVKHELSAAIAKAKGGQP